MQKKFIIGLIFIVIASFKMGQWYQQFHYEDICLDMGGGRNPDGYPICVIEKPNGS